MNPHLSMEQLVSYVTGESSASETRALEAHVRTCARCARGLEREAAVEMSLVETASRPQRPRPRRTFAAAVGVAMAACSVLVGITLAKGAPTEAGVHTERDVDAAADSALSPDG